MPYFDTQKSADHGVLQYVGSDHEGSLVFSVGLETSAQPVIKAISTLLAIARNDIGHVQFIETMPAVNTFMKVGGVCSRVFGLKGIGRPLIVYGTRHAFRKIVQLVNKVKDAGNEEVKP